LSHRNLENIFIQTDGIPLLAEANFTKLKTKVVAPALASITTASCEDKLQQAKRDQAKTVATDATYSSRSWHANEITIAAENPITRDIIGRVHLLKDTASGATQHSLRDYDGTSHLAEGDGWVELHDYLLDHNYPFAELLTDGDACCFDLARTRQSDLVNLQDPNHYAKRINKDLTSLGETYPVVVDLRLPMLFQSHFLIGCKLAAERPPDDRLPSFRKHLQAFVRHISDPNYDCSECLHPPGKRTLRLDKDVDTELVAVLNELIGRYLVDASLYLHGLDTNGLEALFNKARKYVSKRINYTVMYGPLFDHAIYERNDPDGKQPAIPTLLLQTGHKVSLETVERTQKLFAKRKKKDNRHKDPEVKRRRKELKELAIQNTAARKEVGHEDRQRLYKEAPDEAFVEQLEERIRISPAMLNPVSGHDLVRYLRIKQLPVSGTKEEKRHRILASLGLETPDTPSKPPTTRQPRARRSRRRRVEQAISAVNNEGQQENNKGKEHEPNDESEEEYEDSSEEEDQLIARRTRPATQPDPMSRFECEELEDAPDDPTPLSPDSWLATALLDERVEHDFLLEQLGPRQLALQRLVPTRSKEK
jgi:hypothetical protein